MHIFTVLLTLNFSEKRQMPIMKASVFDCDSTLYVSFIIAIEKTSTTALITWVVFISNAVIMRVQLGILKYVKLHTPIWKQSCH